VLTFHIIRLTWLKCKTKGMKLKFCKAMATPGIPLKRCHETMADHMAGHMA
jgi:hypothetical protein